MTEIRGTDRAHDATDSLTDFDALRDRPVPVSEDRRVREDRDHCGTERAGEAVVGVENDAGEILLLVNHDAGVALLPHGLVQSGDDWAAVARDGVEGKTGIPVELDGVEHAWEVDHVVEGEDLHTTTRRVVFRGSPRTTDVQECKRSAEAGSDDWVAGWFDGLPEDVAPPEGGPEKDLSLFVDG